MDAFTTRSPNASWPAGRPLACMANSPINGDIPGRVWIVLRGSVDLFGVRRSGEGQEGHRYPLFRADAGQVIFDLPAATDAEGGQVSLVLVGGLDTQVYETTVEALLAAPGDLWATAIDAWLTTLFATLLDAPDAWPGHAAPALEALHRLAGQALATWVEERHTAEQARLTGRYAQDCRIHERTLRQVNDILTGRSSEPLSTASEQQHPPLLEALLRVAQNQGMSVPPLVTSLPARTSTEEQVQALARLMGVRVRRVLLRERWWKAEAGPLVAFLGEAREPVALLPHGVAGYRLVPVEGGDGAVVDETLAEALAADAYALYVPLPSTARRIRDLLGMAVRTAKGDLLRVLGMGLLVALLSLATPIFTGYLIDTVIPRAELHRLAEAAIALLLIALGATVFRGVQALGILRAEGSIDHSGQAAVFQRLLTLPTAFFRSYTVGDLADRSLGFQHIRRILTGTTLQALLQGVFSTVSIGLLFYYDWRLALIACTALAVVFLLIAALTVAQRRATADRVRWQGRIDGLTVQLLSAIGKLRIAAAEERAFARWFSLVIRQKACQRRAQYWANWAETLAGVVPIFCTGVVFVGLSLLLREMGWETALTTLLPQTDIHGADGGPTLFTTGDFMAFNAAYGQAIAGYLLLARALPELIEAGPYLERLRPILEATPEGAGGHAVHGSLSGAVTLNRVTFRYQPGGTAVIDAIDLQIESGTFVALVGPSGGGKSTLVRLLLGFETPESGTIAYDGIALDQLDLTAMRSQIGVVLQNGRINHGSIAENIIGTSGASLEEAWTAASMVGLADDIKKMPMGMHTLLVEGAQTISGGQRQRLLLARAVVGRPRLVILDEATSALDNRMQEIVTASLDQLRCTRIVVAHRLSTIRGADKIIVVDGGRIVEMGSYDTLMAADGMFKSLVRRQVM